LAPLLFHDTALASARAERSSPVAPTEPSEAAKAKKATKQTPDGLRVMSFADLIAHLGTLVNNTMRVPARPKHRFTLFLTPTPLQKAAFRLLGSRPRSCPVAEKPDRTIAESDQSHAYFTMKTSD
jgi:hypothetical protein